MHNTGAMFVAWLFFCVCNCGWGVCLRATLQVKQCFWDLASVDLQTRKQAAETLAQALKRDAADINHTVKSIAHAQQQGHGRLVKQDVEANRDADEDEPSMGKEAMGTTDEKGRSLTSYVWDRLARGLASPRAAARQGFALAMCLALQDPRCPVSNAEVFRRLQEHLSVNGKGREARDSLLGRLFGIGALARATRLGGQKDAIMACELVVDAAERKQFLQEPAAAVIVEIVDGCDGNLFEAKSPLHRWMVKAKPEDARAPHALYALLACWEDLPENVAEETVMLPIISKEKAKTRKPKKNGKQIPSDEDIDRLRASSFLESEHLERLAPVFAATSCAHPRTHRTWLHLLGMLIHGTCTPFDLASKPDPRPMFYLHDFWKLAVEGPLLEGGSHERKFLAMELFEILLPWVVADQIPVLLSETFLLNLRTHVKNKNSLLHKKAEMTEATIENFMARHATDSTRIAIDTALQGLRKHSHATTSEYQEDVKPKALGLEERGSSDQENFDALLHRFVSSRVEEEQDMNSETRTDILEEICRLFKNPHFDDSLRCEALRFLAAVSFLEVSEFAKNTSRFKELELLSCLSDRLNISTRNMAIARLSKYSALYSQQKKGLEVNGERCDGLKIVLDFIQSSLQHGAALVSGDVKEINSAVQMLRQASTEAQKMSDMGETSYTTANFNVVQHFLMVHEFQLYVEPYAGYLEAVEDVCTALGKAWAAAPPDWTALLKAKEEDQDTSQEPYWMDVLVDAMMIFLTKSSSIPYEAASALFRVFADHLSRRGLEDLLDQISSKPGTIEGEDESESGSEEEGSSEEDTDSEEESPAASDNGSDLEEEVAASPAEDEDDDVVFSDEQMFKLDKYLVDAFHSARERIFEGKQAAEQVVSFKLRVIGLLEIYVKKCPTSPLLPFSVHRLLKFMQLPLGSTELKEGLSGLLKGRICKSKAEASGSKITPQTAHSLLKGALEMASQSNSKEVSSAAEQCSKYLLRVALGALKATGSAGLDVVTRELTTDTVMDYFLKKKCHLSHSFLVGTVTAFPEIGLTMLPKLLSKHEDLSEFLFLEGMQFMLVIMRSCTSKFAKEIHGVLQSHPEPMGGVLLLALSRQWTKQKRMNEAIKLVHQVLLQMLKLQKQVDQELSLPLSSCQKITEAAKSLETGPASLTQHKNMVQSIKASMEQFQASTRKSAKTPKGKRKESAATNGPGLATPGSKSARKARNPSNL
uniref:Myb-binding protein 1A n=2 Tax=Picocystis salinarum TaxID=88271 RepID=A0A7S3XD69_9CHLO|mmetsp:Transcript_6255/g.38899  ORF Transcript_6255/g.38899 Transcript_6255/m.38899 type:complete len:1217 (+) Transcript_6255:170-3820(+)